MFAHSLFAKKSQLNPTVFFVDFDGTLFTPDKRIITAPFYNFQTKHIVERYQIPFVVVTGRSTWSLKSEIETMLLGLPKPDAIITGAGSIIYYRLSNGQLALDTSWEKRMRQTTLHVQDGEKIPWDRKIIIQKLQQFLPATVEILPNAADKYLIRLYVNNIPLQQLLLIRKTLENYFLEGVHVLFTEKLLQKNTLEICSGNILLVPSTAGKENAVRYVINVIARNDSEIVHAYCFGDATIDVPMLTIQSVPKKFDIQTYGVNLTPLAKKLLQEQSKTHPNLHIIESPHSPQAILEVIKKYIPSGGGVAVGRGGLTHPQKMGFSPAQNTPARLLLQPFESFLDTFFDQRLSANQISFKGLEMIEQSVDLLYAKKSPSVLQKLLIWKLYAIGNLTDIFDGIRARQTNTISNEGQLVDVFCDRAKEFYQIYKRAEKRLSQNQQQGYQTFLTAISCILPSIARAQAEISGTIVKEHDANGGSMLARTRKLFFAFFYETLNLYHESIAIDQRIYTSNIATYQNRLNYIPSTGGARRSGGWVTTSKDEQTPIQQKAQERFLLLIQLLQEENDIIEKTLNKHPELLHRYKKEFKNSIEKYLKIDVKKEREIHKIQEYNLSLKKVLR